MPSTREWTTLRATETVRVTALAVVAMALTPLSSAAADRLPAARSPTVVSCAGDRHFILQMRPQYATIFLRGRQLRLERRESSLGRQYHSSDASLIIDGEFVAFVTKDDLGFENCRLIGAK